MSDTEIKNQISSANKFYKGQRRPKVLIVGYGIQGKAAVQFAENYDIDVGVAEYPTQVENAKKHLEEKGRSDLSVYSIDASDKENVKNVLAQSGADVVAYFGPNYIEASGEAPDTQLSAIVADACIEAGCHFTNSSYAMPELIKLDEKAKEANIVIFPEMGLDPGIDLLMASKTINELESGGFTQIKAYNSIGTGIPDDKDYNVAAYVETWSLENVLKGWDRKGVRVEQGKLVHYDALEKLSLGGSLNYNIGDKKGEIYINGDVEKYLAQYGVDVESLEQAGRYSMRHQGTVAYMKDIIKSGFLSEEETIAPGEYRRSVIARNIMAGRGVSLDSISGRGMEVLKDFEIISGDMIKLTEPISPRKFLHDSMKPKIQLLEGDFSDWAAIENEIHARNPATGEEKIVTSTMQAWGKDLGMTAMNATVAGTVMMSAVMIAEGKFKTAGIVRPTDRAELPLKEMLDSLGKTFKFTEVVKEISVENSKLDKFKKPNNSSSIKKKGPNNPDSYKSGNEGPIR